MAFDVNFDQTCVWMLSNNGTDPIELVHNTQVFFFKVAYWIFFL